MSVKKLVNVIAIEYFESLHVVSSNIGNRFRVLLIFPHKGDQLNQIQALLPVSVPSLCYYLASAESFLPVSMTPEFYTLVKSSLYIVTIWI